ncbi:MAG: cytochrome c oxidase subunit II [Synechococcaceae cyanobacterium]|nr:cytochrome c oxidase subunit II [Synechococcaceae cyanobacterium]
MPIPTPLITLLVGMVLVLTGIWASRSINLLPLEASSNAPVYDSLFAVLFSIGTILFLGIAGLLVFSLVRFRRRLGDNLDGAAIEGNLPLEILWTAIPAIVVLFIGIYSYDIYERMGGMAALNDHSAMHHQAGAMAEQASATSGEAAAQQSRIWGGIGPSSDAVTANGSSAAALPIELTAMQFAFIFHYPDQNITSGELHVPLGTPIELRMKANDVIHAFWVPQFRLKQDVIPGQPTVLTFTPTRAGSYPIVCAELCGPYHGGMRSTVVVHEQSDYDSWVQKNSPASLAMAPAAATA